MKIRKGVRESYEGVALARHTERLDAQLFRLERAQRQQEHHERADTRADEVRSDGRAPGEV